MHNYTRNIRAERVRAGMTQEEMASEIGMANSTYSLKESGKHEFTVTELMKICTVLQTTPETLLRKPN